MLKNIPVRGCLAAVAFLSLGACISSSVTHGTYIDSVAVEKFEIGVATYDDIVDVHGTPQMETRTSDGLLEISYFYVESDVRLFAPHEHEISTVKFVLGPDGKLQDVNIGKSETKINSVW